MTAAVCPEMNRVIQQRLQEIAKEEDILILFAVESGSRAWGFHSPDSDYDVRFVYARPVDWHLSLDRKRDVIERPINDELDICGWELGKALKLALSSNAVIAEWLQSPIRYQTADGVIDDLTDFAAKALGRKSVSWHYLSLITRHERRLRDGEDAVFLKRYFYMLRSMLALRWMRLNDRAMAPMAMAELIKGCELSAAQHKALAELTTRKMLAPEKGQAEATDPVLDALLSKEMQMAQDWLKTATNKCDKTALWHRATDLNQRYCRMAGA